MKKILCFGMIAVLILLTSCTAPSPLVADPSEMDLPDTPLYVSELPEFWTNETFNSLLTPYYELQEKDDTSWSSLIDNETPLTELLDKNETVMSTEMAWYCSVNKYDTRGRNELSSAMSAYIYEALYGTPIHFVRDTGKTYENLFGTQGHTYKKMYTAFRVEDGGIMFCFFDWCEQTNKTVAKRAVWVTDAHTYADFKDIKVGDPATAVLAIDPIARFPMANSTVKSTHLLKDGVIEIRYEEDKVSDIQYYSDYIVPNTAIFMGTDDAQNLDYMTSEMLQYNLSVLPQDYPQS